MTSARSCYYCCQVSFATYERRRLWVRERSVSEYAVSQMKVQSNVEAVLLASISTRRRRTEKQKANEILSSSSRNFVDDNLDQHKCHKLTGPAVPKKKSKMLSSLLLSLLPKGSKFRYVAKEVSVVNTSSFFELELSLTTHVRQSRRHRSEGQTLQTS